MREFYAHDDDINGLSENRKRNEKNIDEERKGVKQSLTNDAIQFKIERINKQVDSVILKVNNNPAPNMHKRQRIKTLTPSIEGRI